MNPSSARRQRRPALRTRITRDPLEASRLLEGLGDRGDGGVVVFLGRVREENRGRPVLRLHYEAYLEMAAEELARIAREVAEAHDVGAISAVHRVGTLEPGEASLAVAVAAPHREEAFRASRAVVETVKARLPIWKREVYGDGTARWLGAASLDASAEGSSEAAGPIGVRAVRPG